MKITMMLIADYASVDPQTGKLNILGIFRNIEAQSLPTVHPRLSLVVKLEGEANASQSEHAFQLDVADEDGASILNVEGPFSMPASEPGILPECNLILESNGLHIPYAGQYRFHLTVDEGRVEASTVMQVTLREK